MKVMEIVDALMRRETVKVDDQRAIVVLDVGTDVAARFIVVDGENRPSDPMTLGAAVSMTADLDAITMDEAFLVDALQQSEKEASSEYLKRVLDKIGVPA